MQSVNIAIVVHELQTRDERYKTLERRYADTHDDLAADVFVSGGEHERESGFSIVDDALGFVESLEARGYPNLRATAAVLEGDGHSNCIGNAVSKGLRALSR